MIGFRRYRLGAELRIRTLFTRLLEDAYRLVFCLISA